jgi:hypothetical protein
MKAIRTILYVVSALFVLSAVFVFLPWSAMNAFMGWFGPFAYPNDPFVVYTVKISLVMFAWVGILMAAAVFQAAKYQLFLLIFGATFLSAAGIAVGLVQFYAVPWILYFDGISSAVVGALFLVCRSQALRQESSSG